MKGFLVALLLTPILVGCAIQESPSVSTRRAELWRSPIADSPPGAGQVWPSGAPAIYARTAIMIDARSGLTLWQKYADVRTQVASTQKLLTALIVLRRGNLDDRVFVRRKTPMSSRASSEFAPANPTRAAHCFRP